MIVSKYFREYLNVMFSITIIIQFDSIRLVLWDERIQGGERTITITGLDMSASNGSTVKRDGVSQFLNE